MVARALLCVQGSRLPMTEKELLERAIESGGLTVAVGCLTLVVFWLIRLNGNHLKHWTEEMQLTREAYEKLTETLADLKAWCSAGIHIRRRDEGGD